MSMTAFVTQPDPQVGPVDLVTNKVGGDLPENVPAHAPFGAEQVYPRLVTHINVYPDQIVLGQDGGAIAFPVTGAARTRLQTLFMMMDGGYSLGELEQRCAPDDPEQVRTLVQTLDQQGVLENAAPLPLRTGLTWLGELEVQAQGLHQQSVAHNPYWQALQGDMPVPVPVAYGVAIELYHLSRRLGAMGAPILSFPSSASVRQGLRAFQGITHGYSQQLGIALQTLGLDGNTLAKALPLPPTMALGQTLTFWAYVDPSVFLGLLGVISDRFPRDWATYLAACERLPLNATFLAPLQPVTMVAAMAAPQDFRQSFRQAMPSMSVQTQARLHAQVHLFMELYDQFYRAIWSHYAATDPELQPPPLRARPLSPAQSPTEPYRHPCFKDRICFRFQATDVEICDRTQGCALTPVPDHRAETMQLLQLLQVGGFSPAQLAQQCPGIQSELPELIAEFDRRGFLHESMGDGNRAGMTGRQFARDLDRFLSALKQQFPPSPFTQKMAEGTISRNQLIGYALESYHVTHLCPQLLAPALAKYDTPVTQQHLRTFYVSELHHDQLLAKSLQSVGITPTQLQQMIPLATTFAVCASLGVFAQQDPLSFKAALCLFETDDPTFLALFQQRSQALELPSDFYQPILHHASINADGGHQDITRQLLADVAYISPEEQRVVQQNLTLLMESMVLRTHELLSYYGGADAVIPRCFPVNPC